MTKARKTDHDAQICTKHGKATKPKTYQKFGVPVHCLLDELLRSSQLLLSSPTQQHRYDTCCGRELHRCKTATRKPKIVQRRIMFPKAGHVQQFGEADAKIQTVEEYSTPVLAIQNTTKCKKKKRCSTQSVRTCKHTPAECVFAEIFVIENFVENLIENFA